MITLKRIEDILQGIEVLQKTGPDALEIRSIHFDSRKAGPGDLFVAYKGVAVDGHAFIRPAIEKGVSAVVCGRMPENCPDNVAIIRVADPAHALGIMASNFYGQPSKDLKLVGVTGTNGKTTVATLLYGLFTQMGNTCGLISTVRNLIGNKELNATHTTPDALVVNQLLREMADNGCSHCFMEVSSHALAQHRVAGIHFEGAIFTNISHDHLDYHHTFGAYLEAKQILFNNLHRDSFALYNRDDKNGQILVQNTRATRYSYSLKNSSDFKARIIEQDMKGMLLELGGHEAWFGLVGTFNAYNLTAVYATAFILGSEPEKIITTLTMTRPVEGRFQVVHSQDKVTAIIDYAHTPDALLNVLNTINAIRTRNEQLICVLGCGGDRDKEKRPMMARVATLHCDRVILTSDNPRSEDPDAIIKEMLPGISPEKFKKALQIIDRQEAIKTAIALAQPGDIILVAGKGHEKYQEIKGVKHPFDDYQIVQDQFKNLRS